MYRANVCGLLDGEWLYYNLSAEIFHTNKLCSRLYSTEIEFFFRKKRIAFKPPFGGFRDNVHTPSIAHWKARSRLNICSALFGFITKHACHRRTDERTELRLPRPR